ncbi:hypothetical protein KC323_g207 [Hortaea werneckii]|nr:hypothetical protein KC323_g207 [Hortaea werneckii]
MGYHGSLRKLQVSAPARPNTSALRTAPSSLIRCTREPSTMPLAPNPSLSTARYARGFSPAACSKMEDRLGACASGVVSSAWPLVSGCSANGANVLGNNDMPLAKCPKWNIHLRIYNDNEQLAIERQEVRGDDLHVRSRLGEMRKAIGLFNEATEP